MIWSYLTIWTRSNCSGTEGVIWGINLNSLESAFGAFENSLNWGSFIFDRQKRYGTYQTNLISRKLTHMTFFTFFASLKLYIFICRFKETLRCGISNQLKKRKVVKYEIIFLIFVRTEEIDVCTAFAYFLQLYYWCRKK